MLQRLIDDVKDSAGSALRMTSLAASAAISLFITLAFLCAAAFVYVLQHYGPVQACLAGAALFFAVALVAAGVYMARKRQMRQRAQRATKASAAAAFADPVMIATGLQIVRAIGIKRLIPILAVGGIALGIMASRGMATGGGGREQAEE